MALMVNPEQDAGGFRNVRPGRKLMHGVGANRWVASTGTPMLTLGFVVLRDAAEGGDDSGLIVMERFAVTAAALFRLADWALATQFRDTFNAESDEDIKRILAHGPVVAKLGEETYKGETRIKVDEWAQYTGDVDPGWDAKVLLGEQEFAKIMQRMADKRANGGGAPPSGGSGGGTYSGGGTPDDRIPF
jgi:hypothetical protein